MRLRRLAPALFAGLPVPMMTGIFEQIVERLGLDADAENARGSDLRVVLGQHTARYSYQKALRDGTERFGIDAQVAGEVTPEQRDRAAKKVEKLKAKAKAKAAKARNGK
jgi:sRNA-binding protein